MADIAVLGAGLAGLLLAHEIRRRGGTVALADETPGNDASRMAPGIINPLAGRKLRPNDDYAASRETTLATFATLESRYGRQLWHPQPLVRLFENERQAAAFAQARREDGPNEWVGKVFAPGTHGPAIADPHGSFETLGAGWLDVPALVEAARQVDAAEFVAPEALREAAPVLVDCRGWRCSLDPHWATLPWKCARGEVLEIELADDLPRHLWNGGGWLQPLPKGTWRAGATYAWSQFEAPPQLTARAELLGKLRRWLRAEGTLVGQAAGVRAVVVDYQPLLGALPGAPRRHLFSGLGSHGAIQGPPCAALLARHLLEGAPLPRRLDVARFAG
ncbi:MAG: NAD(P)/FAD-dependent oxidoreductase [Opitutales bacterium]